MSSRNRGRTRDRENGPKSRAELEVALDDLIRVADANGVRVNGGFGLRHSAPNRPDWAIEIARLQKRRVGENTTRKERHG